MQNLINNYRRDIDGLRAIAVLAVVFFHTFPNWCKGGFVGVDIFFVISGYLITSILVKEIQGNNFSLTNFYRRRAQRIFPALILVLGSSLLWGWSILLPSDFRALAQHVGAGATFASNLLMYSETGYFEQAIELKPLMHLWSLGVEEQFYLVWPVFLIGIVHAPRLRQHILLVIGLVATCSFLLNLWQVAHDQSAAFYLPFARFWELLSGALLVFMREHRWIWRGATYWAIGGLFLLLVSIGYLHSDTSFPGWWALLPVVGAFILIGSGPDTPVHRTILENKVFVGIGLISYPLYLWHWVLLSFIRIGNDYPAWPLRLGGVGISLVLSWATYAWVEKHLRHSRNPIVLWGLVAALLGTGILSLGIIKSDWFVRTPTVLEQQLSRPYNTEAVYRYKRCFLDPLTQGPQDFADECISTPTLATSDAAPRQILLWGDSLSAQLYSGLRNLVESAGLNLFIAQLTAGSCPPGLEQDQTRHGACEAINAATRKYIERTHPYAVVINGRWENGRLQEVRIPEIVQYLRAQGVVRILLVGPTPDWAPDLKKLLLRRHFTEDLLPERMNPPPVFWATTLKQQEQLKSLATVTGIDFISPIDAFCEGSNCLIRVSDSVPDGLIASDHDHMTEQAAKYLFMTPKIQSLFKQFVP